MKRLSVFLIVISFGLGGGLIDFSAYAVGGKKRGFRGVYTSTRGISTTFRVLFEGDQEAHHFVDKHYLAIQEEAAQGRGMHLEALAQLLGREKEEFSQWMQRHYAEIFLLPNQPQKLLEQLEKKEHS